MADKIATRAAYGKTLVKLGESEKNLIVMDADLSKSTMTAEFAKAYPERFFNMGIAEQNLYGTAAGLAFLAVCDEVWQWGKTVTEGMAAELARAKELGIPIKVYNTLGIPYEQWNSVKLANDPTYIAECRKAGREL